MSDLASFQSSLGFTFQNEGLLVLALTHPSLSHEEDSPLPHNQRLEFLGDAVLQFILTVEMYRRFPDYGEGQLTQARARLVNQRTLADKAQLIRLGDVIRMSRGEEQSGGRTRPSILADTFEAVLGAMHLDQGLEKTGLWVLPLFERDISEISLPSEFDNPKGQLQEILQSESSGHPIYNVESVTGPDHDRVFECSVSHRGNVLGRGNGKSKKAAEARAALDALGHLLEDARQKKLETPPLLPASGDPATP